MNDGPTQNPAKDGIPNLFKFVLGGNPLASNPSILPVLTVTPVAFVFSFNRADDSLAEVNLSFQYGSNLAGWTAVPVLATSTASDAHGVVVNINPGTPATQPDIITITVPRSNAVGGKLFGRLVATK